MYYFFVYSTASTFFILCLMAKLLRINFGFNNFQKILNDLRRGKSLITALFQVEPENQRHGGELVAGVLKAHGVKQVFTLCGGHISPILVGCESLGIRVYDTRHEVNAVFAADAVARLRQNIGVAIVTAGPGITNSITAMKNAQMAESPVLLLGGASPSLLRGRGALQDIDQQILLKPLCKYTARVKIVRDIVPIIKKAIAIAKSGAPGPVYVELPIDVLYPYKTIEKEIGFSKNSKGLKKLLEFFLRIYISRVFGNAWTQQDLSPLPIKVLMAKEEQIDRLIRMISTANKPLILFGSQAMCPPIKPEKLCKTIESLGIPAYLGGMSRGLLGADSPLLMRQNRKEALKDSDLVILAGAICDFRLNYGKVFNNRAQIVSINRDRRQMLKNNRLFWQCDLAIQADVASTLVELEKALRKVPNSEMQKANRVEWLAELCTREQAKEMENNRKIDEQLPDGRLNPLLVLKSLDSVLSDDTILVADGGDFVGSGAYIVRPRGPLQWLDPGSFGTLGVGAGFALGAKVVYPDKNVVIIYGDGASGFSLIEFDTFARHKLPIVAVIGNDACWSQIAREQVPWFGSDVSCQLAYTNYDIVGKGLGAEGISIEGQINKEECSNHFRQAFEIAKTHGKPIVMNVLIGKTTFRQGSISV